jgi:hypothetical protein
LNDLEYVQIETNNNTLSVAAVPDNCDLKKSLRVFESHSVYGLIGTIKPP